MGKDTSFYKYIVEEILENIPGIQSRSMFGGWGIFKDGIFFALIADGALYFKVDENNKKDYEEFGSEPFVYTAKGKSMTMSYWNLSEEIMNDREKLIEWVDKSVSVALRTKKNKS